MGLFDTLHFDQAIPCPACQNPIPSVQTHALSDSMENYKVGAILKSSPILTGVFTEELFCHKCFRENPQKQLVYVVIWHSILAGIEHTEKAAEEKLKEIDRLDLIGWLDSAQTEEKKWKQAYYKLYRDLEDWHTYTQTPQDNTEKPNISKIWRERFIQEIIEAENPIQKILEKNKTEVKNPQET
jgi:hypothetical protein